MTTYKKGDVVKITKITCGCCKKGDIFVISSIVFDGVEDKRGRFYDNDNIKLHFNSWKERYGVKND